MATRVTLVHAGMRELIGDPGVEAYLMRRMDAVANEARAIAPVRTGAYKASIRVDAHHESSGRVVARVSAGTDHAFLVEAQSGTLGRSMGALRA